MHRSLKGEAGPLIATSRLVIASPSPDSRTLASAVSNTEQ
jgi:hypothetical protein